MVPPAALVAVSLSVERAALVALAGVGAGLVNGVAGGGTMVSFPALLALGYPALTANMTSTVGIWPGYAGGVTGYRTEIVAQRDRILRLVPWAVLGAAGGAALLLTTSQSSFRMLAPWLVLAATALFAMQPLLQRSLGGISQDHPTRRWLAQGGTLVSSVYGGYFGAGMGVVMLAVLGLALPDAFSRTNAVRAALAVVVNGLAALVFVVRGEIAWEAAGLLALGSLAGGWVGAATAHRIPASLLRVVVVGIGAATAAKLLAG